LHLLCNEFVAKKSCKKILVFRSLDLYLRQQIRSLVGKSGKFFVRAADADIN
jgi:hypothetical protein